MLDYRWCCTSLLYVHHRGREKNIWTRTHAIIYSFFLLYYVRVALAYIIIIIIIIFLSFFSLSLSIHIYIYIQSLALRGSWCAGWLANNSSGIKKIKKKCGRVLLPHERNEKTKMATLYYYSSQTTTRTSQNVSRSLYVGGCLYSNWGRGSYFYKKEKEDDYTHKNTYTCIIRLFIGSNNSLFFFFFLYIRIIIKYIIQCWPAAALIFVVHFVSTRVIIQKRGRKAIF